MSQDFFPEFRGLVTELQLYCELFSNHSLHKLNF